MYRYLLLALMLIPNISFAAVRFSEIAWMGTKDSSSNEWIELQNDGSEDISLSGFSIVSADTKIKINLKGSIAANSFYLIERTDDSSVPNVKADLIASFSTGLSNSGETLRLLNSEGSLIDEIMSGSDWKNIGGNSETKNTPQLVGGVWVTGVPTPRELNVGGVSIGSTTEKTESENQTITNQTTTITSSGSGSSASRDVDKKVRDNYKIVMSHEGSSIKDQPKKFKVSVFGLKNEELKNADIKWNFGDGATATGYEVAHAYKFEGSYPLVIWTTYNDLTAELKTKIDVLSQDVKILNAKPGFDGYIKVKSNIDSDISGYYFYDGEAKFVLPKGSQIYSKYPITFPNSVTGIIKQDSLLLFRSDGKLISSFGEDKTESVVLNYNYSYVEAKKIAPAVKAMDKNSTSSDLLVANVGTTSGIPAWAYWAISAFFVLAILIIIFTSKVFNKNRELESEAAKYTLVEIDSNLE